MKMWTERSLQTGRITTATFEPKSACSFETSTSGDKDTRCQNPRGRNMKLHRSEPENVRTQNHLPVWSLKGPDSISVLSNMHMGCWLNANTAKFDDSEGEEKETILILRSRLSIRNVRYREERILLR